MYFIVFYEKEDELQRVSQVSSEKSRTNKQFCDKANGNDLQQMQLFK